MPANFRFLLNEYQHLRFLLETAIFEDQIDAAARSEMAEFLLLCCHGCGTALTPTEQNDPGLLCATCRRNRHWQLN